MSKTASLPRAGRESASQVTTRSTMSKSRAEKSRAVTVVSLPQVSAEIVPGRLSESDWLSLLHLEEGEEVVGDIVDSLLTRVMDECFTAHLTRQVIPFTVSQAREAMLQIADWTFVPMDEGQEHLSDDVTWQEQEEPQPCATDSWAQGCVPTTTPLSRECLAGGGIAEENPAAAESPRLWSPDSSHPLPEPPAPEPPAPEPPSPAPAESQDETSRGASPAQTPQVLPQPPPQPPTTKKPYRPHRGPLRSAGLKEITKSLEETEKEMERLLGEEERVESNLLPTALHNLLKIQLGRPPHSRDVSYDRAGNVLSMPRLDPLRLPQRHIRPQAEVVHPTKEASSKAKKAFSTPRTSEEPGRRPREGHRLSHIRSLPPESGKPPLNGRMFHASTGSSTEEPPGAPIPLSAGILLDTMQLSHGVIVREGSSAERGSLRILRQPDWAGQQRALNPIRASVTLPSISVEQLVRNQIPRVHPARSVMAAPTR